MMLLFGSAHFLGIFPWSSKGPGTSVQRYYLAPLPQTESWARLCQDLSEQFVWQFANLLLITTFWLVSLAWIEIPSYVRLSPFSRDGSHHSLKGRLNSSKNSLSRVALAQATTLCASSSFTPSICHDPPEAFILLLAELSGYLLLLHPLRGSSALK